MAEHTLDPVEILLVEDNPGDVRLTQEAFLENKIRNHRHVVTDGEEALLFLRRTGKYSTVPLPDLIILDLNLPKKDGREVLIEIKADPVLRKIPVVVLTTSEAESDVLNSYNLHANCYITKPIDIGSFIKVAKNIQNFWFSIVELPTK